MRLVIQYSYGDGYTYWATDTVPVLYASPEEFMVDFEKACKEAYEGSRWQFEFAGQQWECCSFYEDGEYQHPSILTVDEWFEGCQ